MSYPDDGSNPEAREILSHTSKGRESVRTLKEAFKVEYDPSSQPQRTFFG